MRLVYKFEIHPNKTTSLVLGLSTYAAARLYNVGNYERHNFNELGFDKMPDWYSQKKNLKTDMWYKSLPSQTSQDILQRLDEGWKSYFKLKQTGGIEAPNPPRYKPKAGHFNIKYLNNSFKVLDGNKIRFMISKNMKTYIKEKFNIDVNFFYIEIEKEINNIKQVEFKYLKDERYLVYIVYENDDVEKVIDNGRYISIDPGVCNLAAIYDNKGYSFIISGSTYLNTLYYYNKTIAKYRSILTKQYGNKVSDSKRLLRLEDKKQKRIDYILHKSSRIIVDYCSKNNISKVIIGDWKDIRKDLDFGKETNQKIHGLPFAKFYQLLEYKLRNKGIELIYQKEYNTSKCPINSPQVSKEYVEKGRVKRGIYKLDNMVYNADSGGAYNIMRLYAQEKNTSINMMCKGLSNPNKICICVTRS